MMRISNSKANTFRRCQKKYEFKYVRKLEPKKKSRGLTLGSWMHDLIEDYYLGKNWLNTHRKKITEWRNLFEEEREELGDIPGDAFRLMTSYLRFYKGKDDDIFVLDAEVDEVVTLPNGHEFNFIIDLIVIHNNGVWLWDHKNTSKFMDGDFMLLDTQLSSYFEAAKIMGYDQVYGYPLMGAVFNEIRTKAPTVPQVLQRGGLSVAKNIDTDYFTYLKAIKDNNLDPRDYIDILKRLKIRDANGAFFRRTYMPKDPDTTKNTILDLEGTIQDITSVEERGYFTRSVSKACSWDCDYKDLCILELQGGDTSIMEKSQFKKRGPRVNKKK